MLEFCATSFKFLPPSVRSNILTPPAYKPPAQRYMSSGPPNSIPRRCRSPVLTSAMSSGASGFSMEKIATESPSGEGWFRFETYTYGVVNVALGFGIRISAASISLGKGGGLYMVGVFAMNLTSEVGERGKECFAIELFNSSKVYKYPSAILSEPSF